MNTTDQPTPEPGWRMLDDSAMMLERLVRAIKKGLPLTELTEKAEGLLKRTKFSPLREEPSSLPSQPETPSGPPDALPPKDEAQGWGTQWSAVETLTQNLATFFATNYCPELGRDEVADLYTSILEMLQPAWPKPNLELQRSLDDMNERRKKEVAGAMHSSETWELMHAKRHEELEQAQRALAVAESERDELRAQLQKECDHEWEHVDDSFDHEFGTEQIHSSVCAKCGLSKPYEPETFGDEAI